MKTFALRQHVAHADTVTHRDTVTTQFYELTMSSNTDSQHPDTHLPMRLSAVLSRRAVAWLRCCWTPVGGIIIPPDIVREIDLIRAVCVHNVDLVIPVTV